MEKDSLQRALSRRRLWLQTQRPLLQWLSSQRLHCWENYPTFRPHFSPFVVDFTQRENTGPVLGLTSEEREMFIAGEDLKDEEEDNTMFVTP